MVTNLTSLKFKNATKNLFNIISVIVSNPNVLRYIKYKEGDPLDTSKIDIIEDLMWKNIFPIFPNFDNMAQDEEIKLYINPDEGQLYNEEESILYDVYKIDIFVPLTYWFTDIKELRVFNIAYEISTIIDNQHVSGVGKAKISGYNIYKIGDSHGGLTLDVLIQSPSKSLCKL